MLDLLVQQGRAAGPRVLVGDGDVRSPTLSGLYLPNNKGEASQPASDGTDDVKERLTDPIARTAIERASLVLDLGGGSSPSWRRPSDPTDDQLCLLGVGYALRMWQAPDGSALLWRCDQNWA